MEEEFELRMPPILGLGNDYSYLEKVYEEYWSDEKNKPHLKVSVVIPVYNRKEILGKTLAGILHQTYPLELIEVIIADDGSSDHPEELIEIFEPYFDIKHVRQDDLGYRLSAVRNLGIKHSNNEHIIILDCDMLPMPNLVSSMMKWLHISEKIILIGHRRFVTTDGFSVDECISDIDQILNLPDINSENQIVKSGSNGITIDWREKIYEETNQLKNAGRHVFRTFCGGNVGFSISAWNEIGIFDEDFNHWGGEDTEFGFRAYNKGFWFIPVKEALALHQEPPGGENETDRFEGKKITHEILVEKCPSRYRKYESGRKYEVPKVSVFIPAYNCENFIEDAVNSVLSQSYSDFEILITDDGGTDNTVKIIKKMMKKDKRIRFFPKANGGIGSACNHMLKHAKGEYALQLDGDDVLLPETITKFVEILDNNEIGFVYGDCFLVDSKLNFTSQSYSWSVYDRRKMIDGGMHVHPPRMFRLRDYYRTSKYNEKMENAVDFDFFLKLAEVSDGYHYQQSLYLYRKHGKNTSDTKNEAQTKNSIKAVQDSVDRLGISKMVKIQSDLKNNRRMHIIPKGEMSDFLQCKAYNQRFGVRCSSNLKLTIEDLELILDENALKRSIIVTATSNLRRKLRIGPYYDIKELVEAKELILNEKGWNLHYQTLNTNLDSPIFLITGHFGTEKSAQTASNFIRNLGVPTEIITSDKQHPFSYPSINSSIDFIGKSEYKIKSIAKDSTMNLDEDIPVLDSYNPKEKWKLQGNRLSLTYKELEIWFEMPLDWSMEETHPDLFKLAEFVLLSPFEPDILDGWMPSRKPGIRPGLAFSGGIDSTASMCLMPDRTLLFYHERAGFESILNHENADLFIKHLEQKEGRPVVRVRSNHELIRTLSGKTPGFITDYACAVHVILLADYYQLDSIGTGMPLENSFFFHGQKFRNFQSSAFWKKHSTLFDSVGLSIYQPVMGCSEPMNQVIVDAFGYENLAQSCLRSNGGSICGKCWKCFRKNTLVGKPFEMSHEISTFLAKQPLKMAASTIYSLQKMEQGPQLDSILQNYPHIKELMQKDVSFLEQYYTPALQLLPNKYRSYTESILRNLVPMMESFDLINLFSLD